MFEIEVLWILIHSYREVEPRALNYKWVVGGWIVNIVDTLNNVFFSL